MSGASLRAPPRRRRRVDGVGRPTLAFRAASEPHEVERDLAQAEAAAPGRHEEREREVREVGDALVERVRRARHGLGHDGRVVVAVRPPVGPVAVEPDVEGVVDGLDAGVVRREERRHGPRVARPDAVRPQPRRQQVDEHEGQRRQDDGPVPVELALELLRGRVLAVDAPRLGEGVPLGERHERVVHDVAEERRLGQGGHEVRAGARRQRQQVRERVDGVLGVEDPALGRGLGRREPGFSHVPDERALQLPERRRALAAATHLSRFLLLGCRARDGCQSSSRSACVASDCTRSSVLRASGPHNSSITSSQRLRAHLPAKSFNSSLDPAASCDELICGLVNYAISPSP